jgi:hypothetical protein
VQTLFLLVLFGPLEQPATRPCVRLAAQRRFVDEDVDFLRRLDED